MNMFLIRRVILAQDWVLADAMLLDSARAIDVATETWQGWINRKEVACELRGVSELGTGEDSKGIPLSILDGKGYLHDLSLHVKHAAENHLDLFFDSSELAEPPFLLTVREDKVLVKYRAVVELLLHELFESADFQAFLSWEQAFEKSSPFNLPPDLQTQRSRQLIQAAQQFKPCEGLFLPIGTEASGGYGAAHLKKMIAPHVFEVEIFTCKGELGLNANSILLSRSVRWIEKGIQKEQTVKVGRILERTLLPS